LSSLQKNPLPAGRGFLGITSFEGRKLKDCSTDKFWGWGVKKLSFPIASNLKTIFADFP
jgi:hypothetical protein